MVYFLHMDKSSFAPDKLPQEAGASGVHARRNLEDTRVQRAPDSTWERFTTPPGDTAENTRVINRQDVADAINQTGSDLLHSDIQHAYGDRAEFNDMPVDPELLAGEEIPAHSATSWYPEPRHENRSIEMNHGLDNRYSQEYGRHFKQWERAVQEAEMLNMESRARELAEQAAKRRAIIRGEELRHNESMGRAFADFDRSETNTRVENLTERREELLIQAKKIQEQLDQLEELPSSYLDDDDEGSKTDTGAMASQGERWQYLTHLEQERKTLLVQALEIQKQIGREIQKQINQIERTRRSQEPVDERPISDLENYSEPVQQRSKSHAGRYAHLANFFEEAPVSPPPRQRAVSHSFAEPDPEIARLNKIALSRFKRPPEAA